MNRKVFLAFLVLVIGLSVEPVTGFNSHLQRCPPLGAELGILCKKPSGMEVNCTETQEVGSGAKCKPHYVSRTGDNSKCTLNGTWTVPNFECQMDCGRVKSSSGLHRPFHAVILQAVKVNQTVKICSGSLIDEKLILTTRHCLVEMKGNVLEPRELFVQLGQGQENSKTNLLAVLELYFVPISSSDTTANATDLAILRLERNVEFSDEVVPICLPSCEQTDSIALRDGSFGEVMSEGKSAEQFIIKLSEECSQHNMICAGKASGGTSLCQEETGLGITVPMVDSIYFLHGVLSNEYFDSCKKLRPFKRVFPYISWIKSVMNFSAEPYDPTSQRIDEYDVEEEVHDLLAPRFECNGVAGLKNKDWFKEIAHGKQAKLTVLNVEDKNISSCELLNSLRLAINLQILNLTDVTLTSSFQDKVTLPQLTSYTLETLENIVPLNFIDYFPFTRKNGSSWTTRDIANLGIDITIENGIKFKLQNQRGILEIAKLDIVDEVLNGLSSDRKWSIVSLTKVGFRVSSIPTSLRSLSLYEPSIRGGTIKDVLKRTDNLESLSLNFERNTVISTSDLPLATLKQLTIGRVNLTNSDKFLFGGKYIFQQLQTLYIASTHTVLDENTRKGFLEIFKTCKSVLYFGNDDFPLMHTILKLENLEQLVMRIVANIKAPNVQAFFSEFPQFDINKVPNEPYLVKFSKSSTGVFDITTFNPTNQPDVSSVEEFEP